VCLASDSGTGNHGALGWDPCLLGLESVARAPGSRLDRLLRRGSTKLPGVSR